MKTLRRGERMHALAAFLSLVLGPAAWSAPLSTCEEAHARYAGLIAEPAWHTAEYFTFLTRRPQDQVTDEVDRLLADSLPLAGWCRAYRRGDRQGEGWERLLTAVKTRRDEYLRSAVRPAAAAAERGEGRPSGPRIAERSAAAIALAESSAASETFELRDAPSGASPQRPPERRAPPAVSPPARVASRREPPPPAPAGRPRYSMVRSRYEDGDPVYGVLGPDGGLRSTMRLARDSGSIVWVRWEKPATLAGRIRKLVFGYSADAYSVIPGHQDADSGVFPVKRIESVPGGVIKASWKIEFVHDPSQWQVRNLCLDVVSGEERDCP